MIDIHCISSSGKACGKCNADTAEEWLKTEANLRQLDSVIQNGHYWFKYDHPGWQGGFIQEKLSAHFTSVLRDRINELRYRRTVIAIVCSAIAASAAAINLAINLITHLE